jgi:chemotaxis protein MotB
MAKGGGSWKVAYADFVTAMMAFFLVMWIGAQDAKTRQSVANYFVDPSGVAKKPARTGSTFDSLSTGSVPKAESAELGKGRDSPSGVESFSPATKLVMDWIVRDTKRLDTWKEKARACRSAAAAAPEVLNHTKPAEELAVTNLTVQLSAAFTTGSPAKANDVYQDLLYESLRDVNWKQVAEDLLGR